MSLLSLFFIGVSTFAQSVSINVSLSPAGSFVAETKSVKGFAVKTADGVKAENISVDIRTLQTGITLRDKHLKERLGVSKYPVVRLVKAVGKNGKGEALIDIKGMKQKVKGEYTIEGKTLKSNFKMRLSDLNIKDANYMGVGAEDEVTVNVQVPLK